MQNKVIVEIAANSLASALAAQRGGADRVELCEYLEGGGVTPSFGSIAMARAKLNIPVHVLIRPRVGDFTYTEQEVEIMLRDIGACQQLGCDGVVIGALTAHGEIDVSLCQELIKAAVGMRVVFHRAFDCASDFETAFQSLRDLGVNGLLTSGQAASAAEGSQQIAQCLAQTSALEIIAGAGINANNATALIAATGVAAVHASAKELIESTTPLRPIKGLSGQHWQTNETLVRALVEAVNRDFSIGANSISSE